FHSDEGAWLANALSQQTGLDASGSSGSINAFVLPSSLSAPSFSSAATAVPDGLGYLQGLAPEDIRLIMSQHMDPSGGMGFADPAMRFAGDVQPSLSMGQDYSTADIQGLMQRLTTFNSSAAEDSGPTTQH
ncbi:hypothetical protein LPJ56_006356, partial [Coemansia sp. RSA 2599]